MQYLTLEQFRAKNSESAAHEASSRTDWLREKLRLSAADTRPLQPCAHAVGNFFANQIGFPLLPMSGMQLARNEASTSQRIK